MRVFVSAGAGHSGGVAAEKSRAEGRAAIGPLGGDEAAAIIADLVAEDTREAVAGRRDRASPVAGGFLPHQKRRRRASWITHSPGAP